jgi:bifunctional non-homologous end joining protein LigD
MNALPVPELPSGNWLYEMKFDGYRALAFKAGREVRLVSRNRRDFGDDYPPLLDALKSLRAKNFLIDGEIAALDAEGRSSFQLLQSYGIRKNIPLVYYAFDLLSLEGTDVRDSPLLGRRKLLAQLLKNAPANIRFSEELQGTREALLEIGISSGSRAWSPRGRIHFTSLADAAVPGSKSKSPTNRSLWLAATHRQKVAGCISDLC